MAVSKMKKILGAFGIAASAAALTIVNAASDLSAADSAGYTEGTGFGAVVPGLAFATAIVVVAVAVVLAKYYCKKE